MALFRGDYTIRCEESMRYGKPAVPIKDLIGNKEYTIKHKLAFVCDICKKKYKLNKQVKDTNICISCGDKE